MKKASLLAVSQATGAAAAAVIAMQEAHLACPHLGVPLQQGIHILVEAVKHLTNHAYCAPLKPLAKTKSVTISRVTQVRVVVEPPKLEVEEEHQIPLAALEMNGCKALLLEIIRRAAYDWVLYRTSERMQNKKLADDAYNWLFKEGPGHQSWVERSLNKKDITSFMAICEALDLDPETVRNHVRRLTVKNVMSVGRPAEYRRQEWRDDDERFSVGSAQGRMLAQSNGLDDIDDSFGTSSFDQSDLSYL